MSDDELIVALLAAVGLIALGTFVWSMIALLLGGGS